MNRAWEIQPARTPVGAALETSGPVSRAGAGAELNHVIGAQWMPRTVTGAPSISVPGAPVFISSRRTGGGICLRLFSRFNPVAAQSLAPGMRVSAFFAAPRLKFLAHIGNQLGGYLTDGAHSKPVLSSVAGFDESHTSEGILRVVQKQSGAFPNVTGS